MEEPSSNRPGFILKMLENRNLLTLIGVFVLALAGVSINGLISSESPENAEIPKPNNGEHPQTMTDSGTQLIEIKFQVISSVDRKPLSGVKIVFTPDGPPIEGLTDDFGDTSIRIPKESEVKISFEKEGFIDKRITASMEVDAATLQIYSLEPEVVSPPVPPVPPIPPVSWPVRNISITVADSKEDGAAWDQAQPKPDIAFCITDGAGRTNCSPEGNSISKVSTAECHNSLTCSALVPIPDGEFNINVLDIDINSDDTIGVGNCNLGQTCKLGQATISTNP